MKTTCQKICCVKAPIVICRHSMFRVIGKKRDMQKINSDSNMDHIRNKTHMTEGGEYPIGLIQNPIKMDERDHSHLNQHT